MLFQNTKLKKIKFYLENLLKPIFVRMTGSGSALVAYFQTKKNVIEQKDCLKRNTKITGVCHQKLYKFYFFVLYEFNIGA